MKAEKLLKKLKKLRARKNYNNYMRYSKLYVRSRADGEVVDHWITCDTVMITKADTHPERASWFVENGIKEVVDAETAAKYFARDFDDYLYLDIDEIIEYVHRCLASGEIPYLRAIEAFLKKQSKELDWFDNIDKKREY